MEVAVGQLIQSNPETTLEEDTVFDLLGNERRRASLKRLIDVDGETPVGELARDVAADIGPESPPPEDVQRSVYISLCQSHLPKLDRASIVEYDADVKTVKPGPAFAAVEPYLETSPAQRDPWGQYLVVSLGTVLVLAGAIALGPSFTTPLLVVLLLVHLGVSGFGVYRLLRSR